MFTVLQQAGKPVFTSREKSEAPYVFDRNQYSETLSTHQGTRLHHLFEQSCDDNWDLTALMCDGKRMSYGGLDRRANQLARYLITTGIRPGDRVGILLRRSFQTYISLLAILKAGAAFVPMDVAFPVDRISFISRDARLAAILTTSDCVQVNAELNCPLIMLDEIEVEINRLHSGRNGRIEERQKEQFSSDQVCYIIYTSGSTGNPKGVAIEHASICNFVQVAADVYDIQQDDRIYQGMTIAFDFSIEEIWPGLLRGATLVAGPLDDRRLGSGLAEFLGEQRVSVFCCVPTLLATVDQDIPSIRTLIVGGEACPQQLVERWAGPKRRMLNTYGPTEATVTATWGELYPGKPVTIGKAMPSYTIYILDETGKKVPDGTIGEICIAGIGLALEYINQPEKTQQSFIKDTFNTFDNPSGRIYRTGDLGRLRSDKEIEYLGRIDTQVKIRGYRIELAEIESVILESEEIYKVAVAPYQLMEDNEELVAYCELHPGISLLDRDRLIQRLRDRLPPYMVPAFVEVISSVPLLANDKADRKSLPAPTGPRLGSVGNRYEPPTTNIERRIAEELGRLLGLEEVSVADDFFLDLGAHSLIVAKLVSTLRREEDMASLALSDLYEHPTIRELADYLKNEQKNNQLSHDNNQAQPFVAVSNLRVWSCGIAQVFSLALVSALSAIPMLAVLRWLINPLTLSHPHYLKIAGVTTFGAGSSLLLVFILPVVLKWTLLGTVKPGVYPLWGWFFLRFWLVDKVLARVPLGLLSGTALLSGYYRILGAKIGKDVILTSPLIHIPDLVTIGNGTSVNTDTHIFCYSVANKHISCAPVSIGENCFIGSNSVLMPGCRIENEAGLGDQSILNSGKTLPTGEFMSGSPASPSVRPASAKKTTLKSKKSETRDNTQATWCLNSREPGYGIAQSMAILAVILTPICASLPGIYITRSCYISFGIPGLFLIAPVVGVVFVTSLNGLIVLMKKMILPSIKPGSYPIGSLLYIRKWFIDRLMEMSLGMTNSLYATLYLAPFLRLMGAKIGKLAEISTISHITPDLLTIDNESFVADIAHVGPAVINGGQYHLAPVHIGKRSFIGNAAFVPGNTTIGDNSLIGVLSVPPTLPGKTSQTVPNDTTWLGSPPLHLPEREQSKSFPEYLTFTPTRSLFLRRLGYEYFRVTLPATLSYIGIMILSLLAVTLVTQFTIPTAALLLVLAGLSLGTGLSLIVAGLKIVVIGTYRPRVRPMWSSFVWRSELITALYENIVVPWLLSGLTGTPFMAVVLRLFGADIGSRCCIETTFVTEFDLVKIGNECAIGPACSLQTHLFEDRVMKMSHLSIGNRCSIGPRVVILYDTTLEDEVELDGLSLVMKGETLATNTSWHGSPARKR